MLLPGFVNAHAHSPMVLLRGAGEGLPVDRWLTEAIWPREGVRAVWVEGRQVVADGEVTTIDVHRAAAEVTGRAVRIAGTPWSSGSDWPGSGTWSGT